MKTRKSNCKDKSEKRLTRQEQEQIYQAFVNGVPLSKIASKLKRSKELIREVCSDFFWGGVQYETYEFLIRNDFVDALKKDPVSRTERQDFILDRICEGWSIEEMAEHAVNSPKPCLYEAKDLEKSFDKPSSSNDEQRFVAQ